jgi:hypothetical protein
MERIMPGLGFPSLALYLINAQAAGFLFAGALTITARAAADSVCFFVVDFSHFPPAKRATGTRTPGRVNAAGQGFNSVLSLWGED